MRMIIIRHCQKSVTRSFRGGYEDRGGCIWLKYVV